MTKSGPHQMRIGKRELRHTPTAVLRLGGHFSTAPSGVFAHSMDRISAPISPPLARHIPDGFAPDDILGSTLHSLNFRLAPVHQAKSLESKRGFSGHPDSK